jgi:hypothetical protein
MAKWSGQANEAIRKNIGEVCEQVTITLDKRDRDLGGGEVDEFILPERISSLNVLLYTHKFLKTKHDELGEEEFDEVLA